MEQQAPKLSELERVQILLEEYRVLYGLLTFRLGATDRRLPVAASILALLLGSLTAMPPETRFIFLLGLPLALVCLLLTTANHAKAQEDLMRRIDELEQQINNIVKEKLLAFQSQHPSKATSTGGRSGTGTVWAVFVSAGVMLAACLYVFFLNHQTSPLRAAYASYVTLCAGYLLLGPLRLRQYRYERQNLFR